jgi:4-amino-4-deoxy-L-arabinose transferase-like glycosyltransferase
LVTLGLFFYLKGLRQPAYCLAAGVPIGCALLTRSIMGAAPLGIIAMHLILTRRSRILLSPHVLGGFFIALLLPLVWFGVQYKLHGDHFFTSHLAFISTKIVGTDNSWAPALNVITYAEALLKYYWPWLPLMAAGFAVQAWAAVRDRSSSSIFLVVWILLVILPLSLVETKYGRYLMPIFPALAIVSALSVRRWLPPQRRHAVFMGACVILALVAAFTILFPAKERGLDMRKLAPIAESNSRSDERILIYSYGEAGYDYQNQFLWYANRHSELITDLDHLRTQLRQRTVATGIIDKPSFDQLMGQLEPSVARYIEVLAASESFICFRFNRTAG